MKNKLLLLSIFAVVLFIFAGTSVFAQDDDSDSESESSTPKATSSSGKFRERVEKKDEVSFSPRPTKNPEGTRSEEFKNRLSEIKLKSCEAREDAVKNRGNSLMKLSVKMVGKFDAISKRIQEFYTIKLLPNGKVVTNYDSLVADINTKKSAVETAIKNVPDASTFDCSSDDPKGLMTTFREGMQKVKTALHEYRTSIKNLLVAVKRVAGDDADESPKPTLVSSPTPVATPTVSPTPTASPN